MPKPSQNNENPNYKWVHNAKIRPPTEIIRQMKGVKAELEKLRDQLIKEKEEKERGL